jgi:short-subunit dehydrogenase
LQESSKLLQNAGISCSFIAADCSIDSDIKRLAEESIASLGHIDILVNNAGAAWGVQLKIIL